MWPRVSVYCAVSLDGFLAREDGGLDWLQAVQVKGEDYGYAAFFAEVDALIVGRATWETVQGFSPWPYEGKRVIVLSHRPIEARHGEVRREGALGPILAELAAEGVRRVYLDGGVAVTCGLAEGVVDDLTLSIVPVLLGRGRRLFGELPESRWMVASAEPHRSGLVQLRYLRPPVA